MTIAEGMEDEQARFARVFREHFDAVMAYALARTDVETAKDAVADVFLVAWRRRQEIANPELPWLLGVARKTLADQWRSQRRQHATEEQAGLHASDSQGAHAPEDQVAERDAVLTALNSLREADRELLRLIAWDGLDLRAAAEVLDCSVVTLGVRLHRARKRFDAALKARSGDIKADTSSKREPRRASPAPDGAAL